MPNEVIQKYWPANGLCGRCFICLRPPPLFLWTSLTHCIHVYSLLINTGKGGGEGELNKTIEKVRESIVQKAGWKYQHDWRYIPSIITINVPVVFMARHIMILMGATSLRGALRGPENRDFFGPWNGTSEASAIWAQKSRWKVEIGRTGYQKKRNFALISSLGFGKREKIC